MKKEQIKPDFFILGAPKTGTTSLSKYLDQHPNIFISSIKEPNYFSTDLPKMMQVHSDEEYLALFDDKSDEVELLGEASTWYFYSKLAVTNLLAFNPDAKMIVMLRNPVQMAQSLHSQAVYNLTETVEDFQQAWQMQSQRRERWLLQYKNCCAVGDQLQRLMDTTAGKNVKVILFDDFSSKTDQVYLDVLNFLGAKPVPLNSYAAHNANKQHRSRKLQKLVRAIPKPIDNLYKKTKALLGIKELGLLKSIENLNLKKKKRKVISNEFRKQLVEEFSPQVEIVERILNVDLPHWKA